MELGTAIRLICEAAGSSALRVGEAAGMTQSDLKNCLRAALRDAVAGMEGSEGVYAWLAEIIGDEASGSLVYEMGGKLLMCPYTVETKGQKRNVTLQMSKAEEVYAGTVFYKANGVSVEGSKPNAVTRDFSESGELCDMVAESVAGDGKEYLVKIIQPGQGSSAFYPAEVLKRDGPKVFKSGLHMYWNHPTAAEESARPEGDLHELAAVLSSNAYYDANGPKGEGLYAKAKVFADYADKLAERAAHIGVSIRAYGQSEMRKGVRTLTSFSSADSVDFVTLPGAGGAVLTESAKPGQQVTRQKEGNNMERDEILKLIGQETAPLRESISSLTAENTSLKEAAAKTALALRLSEARNAIVAKLASAELPAQSKLRVSDALLAGNIPATESGALDAAKMESLITEAVKLEAQYVASLLPGQVFGMGASAHKSEQMSEADAVKGLTEFGAAQGLTEAAAKAFAAGRD